MELASERINIAKPVRVIIVDDEIEACYNLKNVIEKYIRNPAISIIALTQNTQEAARLIEELQPDAVFLDIELRKENAFSFLERIAPFHFELIFVTAFDEYAIKAFKLNALDYILKPISIEEVSKAIDKLLLKITQQRLLTEKGIFNHLAEDYTSRQQADSITLRTSGKLDIIAFKDLLYVEGRRSYSVFHFRDNDKIKALITSHSIAEYEQVLPEKLFFRIHKSYLVNGSQIRSLIQEPNPVVLLPDCEPLPVSRRRLSAFHLFLNGNGHQL